MSAKYNIICLSNQLWLSDYWTNKSHVMSRLSKLGHKVLFVEPPINTGNIFIRQLFQGAWTFKRLLTQTKVEEQSGVLIYSPLNMLPNANITSKWHISRVNKVAEQFFDPERKTILWVYHVQLKNLLNYVDGIKHDILIYDCVDNYLGFPENSAFYSTTVTKKQLVLQEEALAKKANLVFATAPGLVERLKNYNPNTHFTPNVGDYEKFKDAKLIKEIPDDLKDIKKPIIGFTGALDEYKFDMGLFKELAQNYPEYSFVLIGSLAIKGKNTTKESLGLADLENVHLLGSKSYDSIQKYFAGFDAFIIPYQLNDYTVGGCFPVKFHDALAAGLPVIVTDLPAYSFFKDVCYISKSYKEFSDNLEKALQEDSLEKIKARQEVAKNNNWDGKVANMLKLIESL
ncbi:MAG: glycosyltransferase [Patescibacteria group bacterium]